MYDMWYDIWYDMLLSSRWASRRAEEEPEDRRTSGGRPLQVLACMHQTIADREKEAADAAIGRDNCIDFHRRAQCDTLLYAAHRAPRTGPFMCSCK